METECDVITNVLHRTAALFLEFWKRYSARLAHRWDVFDYQPAAEHPRPEYLAKLRGAKRTTVNYITQTTEPMPSFWTRKVPAFVSSWTLVVLMIMVSVVAVFGVILYRMSMTVVLHFTEEVMTG